MTHWDFVLKEMKDVAVDVHQERVWKVAMARGVGYQVCQKRRMKDGVGVSTGGEGEEDVVRGKEVCRRVQQRVLEFYEGIMEKGKDDACEKEQQQQQNGDYASQHEHPMNSSNVNVNVNVNPTDTNHVNTDHNDTNINNNANDQNNGTTKDNNNNNDHHKSDPEEDCNDNHSNTEAIAEELSELFQDTAARIKKSRKAEVTKFLKGFHDCGIAVHPRYVFHYLFYYHPYHSHSPSPAYP